MVTFIIFSLIMFVGGICFIIMLSQTGIKGNNNFFTTSMPLNETIMEKNSNTTMHEMVLVQRKNRNNHFSSSSYRVLIERPHYYNIENNMVN